MTIMKTERTFTKELLLVEMDKFIEHQYQFPFRPSMRFVFKAFVDWLFPEKADEQKAK